MGMDSGGLDVGHPLRGDPRDALLLHAYQGPISEVQEEPEKEQIASRCSGGIPRRV